MDNTKRFELIILSYCIVAESLKRRKIEIAQILLTWFIANRFSTWTCISKNRTDKTPAYINNRKLFIPRRVQITYHMVYLQHQEHKNVIT